MPLSKHELSSEDYSKSRWQCSWLKWNCKGQLYFMSETLIKFSKSTVEAVWARSSFQHSGVEGRDLRECPLFMDALISWIAFFELLCPSRSLVAAVHFKMFKGRTDSMAQSAVSARGSCTKAPAVKSHPPCDCIQGCHAQPMLLESRDEHGVGTCNASFRQTGGL